MLSVWSLHLENNGYKCNDTQLWGSSIESWYFGVSLETLSIIEWLVSVCFLTQSGFALPEIVPLLECWGNRYVSPCQTNYISKIRPCFTVSSLIQTMWEVRPQPSWTTATDSHSGSENPHKRCWEWQSICLACIKPSIQSPGLRGKNYSK